MRANGVLEKYITGDADDYEKITAWVKTLESSVGNPLFEWSHLELRRYFGINELITIENIRDIWDYCNKLLQSEDYKPRELIKKMNVKIICTTDELLSDLKYHAFLKNDEESFKVLPTMRVDKLIDLESPGITDYLISLGQATGKNIDSFSKLMDAVEVRMMYFSAHGCRLSDIGLDSFDFFNPKTGDIEKVLKKILSNKKLSIDEKALFKTCFIQKFLELNSRYKWTVQIHGNVIRNNNILIYNEMGKDMRCDSVGTQPNFVDSLMKLLSYSNTLFELPKLIIYSLNPNDWFAIATGMGNFYNSYNNAMKQRIQLGCAWWFNDTEEGIKNQLRIVAQQSILSNFVGMLTDSRSFMSYPRHEYFRRILCSFLGDMVMEGRAPNDIKFIGEIVSKISYHNAKDYFEFDDK